MASIKQAAGVDAVLVPSNAEEVFEVDVDGRCLFSKQKEGRFPGYEEINRALLKSAL